MHPLVRKTFGGLSASYYFRQVIFGSIFTVFAFYSFHRNPTPVSIWIYAFFILSTLIYPYSRFVYESVAGFVMGDNVFYLNAFVMLFFKLVTMAICYSFAIFIAPVGLIYLYFYHSRREA